MFLYPVFVYLQATRFPSSAYKFLRELLGKNVSNPIVKQFQERFPYYKMEDDEERATGKCFMRRVKSRWYEKFPNTNHTAQNLTANARIFWSKNTYAGYPIVNEREVESRVEIRYTRSSMDWIKEMKVRLGELDMQVRSNGKGFTTQKEMGREVRGI